MSETMYHPFRAVAGMRYGDLIHDLAVAGVVALMLLMLPLYAQYHGIRVIVSTIWRRPHA